jgi:uncharacterized protein DUF1707
MAEPGDEIAQGASGRGRLRASHADREQAIETLKDAYIQGRLTKDELDLRVGHALAARTDAELAAVTADLPAGLAAARPPPSPWAPGEPAMPRPGLVLTAATVLYAGVWAYAILFPKGGADDTNGELIIVGGFFYLILLLMAGTGVLANWLDKRSGRQPPRRPAAGAGGQSSSRLPSADPARQLPPVDQPRSAGPHRGGRRGAVLHNSAPRSSR